MDKEEIKQGEQRIRRRLTAVFSADVQGYSRLMGENEEATVRTLTEYRKVLGDEIVRYRGRVVDSPGDNLLAEFPSAVDAVRCGVTVQENLTERNAELPVSRQMHFRIGINVGDVLVEGDRIYGDGVNIAARIESIADGGGVCISSAVFDQVEGRLEQEVCDLGDQQFKNIAKPVQVYRVLIHPESATPAAPVTVPASNPKLAQTDKPSIAVLPFQNLSGDPDQAYFSDGMTEDLITDLSKISGLFVISRNSVFAYKGKAVRPAEVSQDLGVRYVAEGSVRKAGNRVRISAQLIDAKTDYHLWAERYDRELDDIFEVQDEVIRHIVSALAVKLTAGEQVRVSTAPTENLEAYDAFVRGREEYARRERAANQKARELFEQAIELDPKYAEAHAFLGRTYLTEMVNQWSQDPDILDKIFIHGERAVGLDESQPTAHETLAYGYLAQRDHDSAIASAQKAIRFEPNLAEAYVSLGEILSFAGRPAEAIPLVEQAMRLNPRYTPNYLWALGQAHRLLKHYDQAINIFQRVVTRNPEHFVAHLMLAACYAETDQDEKAQAEAREVMRLSPDFSAELSYQRSPYRLQEDTDLQHESLRRAGLS